MKYRGHEIDRLHNSVFITGGKFGFCSPVPKAEGTELFSVAREMIDRSLDGTDSGTNVGVCNEPPVGQV